MANKDSQGDPGLDVALKVVEALPHVGEVLGSIGRQALRKNEKDAIASCLADALRPTDAAVGLRGAIGVLRHPWQARVVRRARRQAARDIASVAQPLEQNPPTASDEGAVEGAASHGERSGADAPTAIGKSPTQANPNADYRQATLEALGGYIKDELTSASAAEAFVPWTDRVSGVLSLGAQDTWRQREAELRAIDTQLGGVLQPRVAPDAELQQQRQVAVEQLLQVQAAVLNQLSQAEPTQDQATRQPSQDEFDAFGDRVGLRFIANMASHDQLQILVRRLDKHDGQRAEAAMVTAMQGLRVAVLLVAAILVVASLALLDIAVR